MSFRRPLSQNKLPPQLTVFELDRQTGGTHVKIKKLGKVSDRKGGGNIFQIVHIMINIRQTMSGKSARKLKKTNFNVNGLENLKSALNGVNRALERARGWARLLTPFRITRKVSRPIAPKARPCIRAANRNYHVTPSGGGRKAINSQVPSANSAS